MIFRFRGCVCCAFLLMLQFVLFPFMTMAAEALSPGGISTDSSSPLVVGFVADGNRLASSSGVAEAIGNYLQEQLSIPVRTRTFPTEERLLNWLSNFREVDVAWLNKGFLNKIPVGELHPLAGNSGLSTDRVHGELVAHQGVDAVLRQRISDVLLRMDETSSGRDLLAQLGVKGFDAQPQAHTTEWVVNINEPVTTGRDMESAPSRQITLESKPLVSEPVTVQRIPVTVKSHGSRQEAEGQVDEPLTRLSQGAAEDSPSQEIEKPQQLVIGFAAGAEELVKSSNSIEELRAYLQNHLSMPVISRTFADEKQLYRWLHNFREVDVAWFSNGFLNNLPGGVFSPLAKGQVQSSANFSGELVAHHGVNAELRSQVANAVQEMEKSASGSDLLAQLGVDRFVATTQTRTAKTGTISGKQQKTVPSVKPGQELPQYSGPIEKTDPRAFPARSFVVKTEKTAVAEIIEDETELSFSEPESHRLVVEDDVPPSPVKSVGFPDQSRSSDEVVKTQETPTGTENNDSKNKDVVLVSRDGRSLSGLFGTSEIAVMASVDGHFIENMAGAQTMGDELTSRVDEADLADSIRAGRSFSRDTLAAIERTKQAKAQTGQAFGLLLPFVSVRVSSGSETSEPSVEVDPNTDELIPSDTHTRTDAALTIRQPLFDLPHYLDWRRRQVTEQARDENKRISDGDAYISTVNAYLSLVSSRLQADVTRSFEDQLQELLDYIEKRASAGAASVSDMARVRARIQETLSSRLEQESAHATAGIEFVRLTNIAPQKVRLPELEHLGVSLLPDSFDSAVTAAMESNPEVAALAAELKAAKIDMKAAKSRYLPRLEAEYTDTYSDGAGGSTDSQRDKRLMAVFSWELFNGGKDHNYSIERAARYKELQYRLDDQRRRIVQALSANYTALETTRNRLATSYEELTSISTAADAMSKRMLSGNQSLLDLLDVYDRYYQVRSRLVSLHVLEMNTVAQLVRLTLGTPLDSGKESSYAMQAKMMN